jgi:hypothetical protein
VIPSFYAGGAYLEEVRFTHPPGDRRGPQRTGLSVAAWEVQPMGQLGRRKRKVQSRDEQAREVLPFDDQVK